MPKNYGRIGNEGFSYFSDKAFENLEAAIKKLEQYNNAQKQMRDLVGKNTKEQIEHYNKMYDLSLKYEKELKNMGFDINTNLALLKRQYENEKEIYDQHKKQLDIQEKEKALNEAKAKFNRLIADDTKEHITQQEKLYKLQERAVKESTNELLNKKEQQKVMDKYVKLYDKLNAKIKEARRLEGVKEAKKDFIQNGVGSLFGTNSQTIQDIKEGTYWFKFGTKLFSEAVRLFSSSVKEGINANYNSTESTLNRITASNRMSWSSGSFSFGGRSYNGYSKLNNAVTNRLLQEGLYNNIANTDVIEATAQLTSSSGFGMDKERYKLSTTALEKAYQDTIIKYIVPYLDTANEAYEMLEMTMPRYVKKCSSYKYSFKRTIWRKSIFK